MSQPAFNDEEMVQLEAIFVQNGIDLNRIQDHILESTDLGNTSSSKSNDKSLVYPNTSQTILH